MSIRITDEYPTNRAVLARLSVPRCNESSVIHSGSWTARNRQRRSSAICKDRRNSAPRAGNIEATPTLVRFSRGQETERIVGWDRDGWRRLTGIRDLGEGLPAFQPG